MISRQQCFEQTEQPVKMVLRFAQQQKIQLSEMCEPYFFYAQSISKVFCAKHLHKIFDNNCATYSLVFATSQTILRIFLDRLKPVKNLAFLKTKRTKKFPAFHFRQRLAAFLQRSFTTRSSGNRSRVVSAVIKLSKTNEFF